VLSKHTFKAHGRMGFRTEYHAPEGNVLLSIGIKPLCRVQLLGNHRSLHCRLTYACSRCISSTYLMFFSETSQKASSLLERGAVLMSKTTNIGRRRLRKYARHSLHCQRGSVDPVGFELIPVTDGARMVYALSNTR
jgi:hypothetical protein